MEELTLNKIDYEWVDNCNDTKELRKAIKLLQEDGGYFKELQNYINEKLKKIDSKYRYTYNYLDNPIQTYLLKK
jgi:hypothetical protein